MGGGKRTFWIWEGGLCDIGDRVEDIDPEMDAVIMHCKCTLITECAYTHSQTDMDSLWGVQCFMVLSGPAVSILDLQWLHMYFKYARINI